MSVHPGFSLRVRAGMAALGLPTGKLVAAVKCSKQLLYYMLSNDRPGHKYPHALAKALRCNQRWLTEGIGKAPSWWTEPPAEVKPPAAIKAIRREVRQAATMTRAQVESLIERADFLERAIAAKDKALDDRDRRIAERDAELAVLRHEVSELRSLSRDLRRQRPPAV